MAASAKLTLTVSGSGYADGGTQSTNETITSAPPVPYKTSPTLNSGDNTISIPAGMTVCCITPDPNNAVALGLGASGAHHIAPNQPFYFALRPGDATFVINSGGAMSTSTTIAFY